MTKYIAVIIVVALVFCFSGKAYCFSMNDLKNAATQAASVAQQAAANKASKNASNTTTTTTTTNNTNANVQNQQTASQQAEQQQAVVDALAKRPLLKAKFDDFNWGDGVLMTKTKLALKRKDIKESDTVTIIYAGQYAQVRGKFLTYSDTVFDAPCTVTLGFSIKTEKLGVIVIQIADNSIIETLNNALTKKYGPPDQNQDGLGTWGGVKKGEDCLLLTVNMLTGGTALLMEYISGEYMPLLARESDEVTNAKISQDSGKL